MIGGHHSHHHPRFQIGVGEEDRARYQQIIAAILHVGEIAFVEKVRPRSFRFPSPFFLPPHQRPSGSASALRAPNRALILRRAPFLLGLYKKITCNLCGRPATASGPR